MGSEARGFKALFPKRHIPTVLVSILQAGENLRKKTANDLEDWISRRLYWRLIRIYPFRDGPLDIRLQSEIVPVDSDENAPAGKIDSLHGYIKKAVYNNTAVHFRCSVIIRVSA